MKQEIDCQIFKNMTFPISFVVYHNVAYPIAAPQYGFGILDIHTCDFDNDGRIDLIYSVSSSGSGFYFPEIMTFNFTDPKETKVYMSAKFEDYMLSKTNNTSFRFYTIDREKLSLDNVQTTLFPVKELGTIVSEKGVPAVHLK